MKGDGSMRKLLSIVLSVLLLLTVFAVPNTYAANTKEIVFGNITLPDGYAELAWHTPVYQFEFWHHSGGYWSNQFYGIKLMDGDVEEGIESKRVIDYDFPVTISTALPDKVKEYIADGGNIDDVLIKFELGNGMQDTEIFKNTPTYSIDNDKITISFEPIFNVRTEHLVDFECMNVHVPTIPAEYGQMVYAMYTPGGTHLGEGSNVEPGDIIDCDGNLRPDKMFEYHMAGQQSQYLPGGQIKIGSGTFANGGAIGLQYLFPIKATYYVTGAEPIDFSISSDFPNVLEVSDGDTLNIPVTVKYKGPLPTADHDPAFMNTNLGACYSDNTWSPMVYTTNVGPLNAEEQTINATIPITVTGLSAYPNGRDLLISVNYPDATKNPNTMSNRNPEELNPGAVINDGKIRLTERYALERNQIPAKKDACTLRNKHLT